jgi:hypothetical protein
VIAVTDFLADVAALARHTSIDPDPAIRATAARLLTGVHAAISEPARVDWAVQVTYDDGEIRYRESLDEEDARGDAHASNTRRIVYGPQNDVSNTAPVFREVWSLVDNTQVTGPWRVPADVEGQ